MGDKTRAVEALEKRVATLEAIVAELRFALLRKQDAGVVFPNTDKTWIYPGSPSPLQPVPIWSGVPAVTCGTATLPPPFQLNL